MVNQMKANPALLHGFKIKLYPTEEQKARIKELSDLSRYVYNWTLSNVLCEYLNLTHEQYNELRVNGMSHEDIYHSYKPPKSEKRSLKSFVERCKEFGDHRQETQWLQKLPTNIGRFAIRNLYNGYRKFFQGGNIHPPGFKAKTNRQVFACRGERVRFTEDGFVRIEGIPSLISCKTIHVPTCRQKYACTITFDGDENYYLSFQTEMINPIDLLPLEGPIGIDVGIRNLATLSDGTVYRMPDVRRLEKRRRRKQSKVAKDRKIREGLAKKAKTKLEYIPLSRRMQKRYHEYRKTTSHLWNIRRNTIHNITREVVNRRPSAIAIENLVIDDLIHSMYKGGQIYEYLFGEFRKQIEYKARWAGIPVIIAEPEYPSSQICSRCGNCHDIGAKHIYKCPVCGLVIDRDLNAALNLRSLAMK